MTITVADSGIGIPEAEHVGIFEAFRQRTGQSANFGGTGLGLAICQRMTEAMGGHISVQSAPGEGSRFSVHLRRLRAAGIPDSKHDSEPSRQGLKFENALILVVDDVPHNRTLIREFLMPWGLTAVEASSGKEALAIARRYRPGLVLLDLKMPGMDGYAIHRALKADEDLRNTPVVAVSAHAMKGTESRVLDSGFDAFLKKPIDSATLIRTLVQFLPHSIGNEEGTEVGVDEEASLAEARDPVDDEVMARLRGELLERWRHLSKGFVLGEIELFATELETLALEHSLTGLGRWSSLVAALASTFDIANLQKTLSSYEAQIDGLKSIGAVTPK